MKIFILLSIICGVLTLPTEDDALQEFIAGNHKFTSSIYKEILKLEKDNFIMSPFSAEIILALANEGARGLTSNELITGLSLPKAKERIRDVFKSFLPKLKSSNDDLQLLSANQIYVDNELELEEEFNAIARSIYESGVTRVDLRKQIETADIINKWVEDNTNNKIKNIIKPSDLQDAVMVLVNSLYFSGKWKNQFSRWTNKHNFFKTKENPVESIFMQTDAALNYYENTKLNAKFLELPYKGENLSMVIVLPNETEGLAKLEENIDQLFEPQPFNKEYIFVEIPKFTTESTIQFKPILKNLGIERIFTSAADLSGLSTYKNLAVSDVFQKAFINVTESGTEAAAATSVVIQPVSAPAINFKADHPFLYFIKHDNIVLFAGRYTTPSD